MASADVNGPAPFPLLKRGTAIKLGTLTAATSTVRFALPSVSNGTDGAEELTIMTIGGTIAAPGIEASLDGGTTWFGIPVLAGAGLFGTLNLTTLNADTAASSASRFDVAGLQGGAVFRFGNATAFPVDVWALLA